jgi:hypothetical protein
MSFTTWIDERISKIEDNLLTKLDTRLTAIEDRIDASALKIITEVGTQVDETAKAIATDVTSVANTVESNAEKFLNALGALPGTIIGGVIGKLPQFPQLPHF